MVNDSAATLLRRLINEVLKVTVQQLSDDGEQVGVDDVREYPDDEMDELLYQLNRFDFKPLKYEKRRKTERPLTPESSESVDTLVSTLSARVAPNNRDAFAARLRSTIDPWGQVGYEALLRILTTTISTKKEFPFFSREADVVVTKQIPFPDSPSKKVVAELGQLTTRIGRNATGRGELLFALLTGALPVSSTETGDLAVNGGRWELKDARSGNTLRLGGVQSQAVVYHAGLYATSVGRDPAAFIDGLRPKNKMDAADREAMTQIVRDVLGGGKASQGGRNLGVSGVVVVRDGYFDVRPTSEAVFYSINNEDRISITLPPGK